MKNLKKKILVLLAVGVVALSASPLALAATPQPADNNVQQGEVQQIPTANTGVPVAGMTTQTTEIDAGKYLSKGGAACWFIIVGLLNIAISFWIGNRFYRLSKKDNHISAEIRALRRDIEDKFVRNVGGFTEQELDIENLNESLAMDGDDIRTADKQPHMSDMSEEEEERFRRWEAAQSMSHGGRITARSSVKSSVREELQEDMDSVRKINRKNYQPKREESETDDEDIGATKEIKLGGNVKSKAKEILNDMFPFKED